MEKNYFASIEFGSLYTTILVVSFNNGNINVVASYKHKSSGYYDARIVNQDNFTSSLNSIINRINKKYKILIDEAIVILPNNEHQVYKARVKNKILTERQIIGISQIDAISKQILKSNVNEVSKIISSEVIAYVLDDGTTFRTPPINKQSATLEIKSSVSTLPLSIIDPIFDALKQSNINVLESYINCFCARQAAMKEFDLEDNSIHVNIGQEITTIAAYSKNILLKSLKINFGVETLIDYLAYNLKCEKEFATTLFESYFVCDSELASDIIFDEENHLSEKRISGIVLNRLHNGFNEILDKIVNLASSLAFEEGYKIYVSGYLNDYEYFDIHFKEFAEMDIIPRNIELIGIHEQCYINNLGAILLFIDQHHQMIINRLDETIDLNVESKKQENSNSRFRDIFDD